MTVSIVIPFIRPQNMQRLKRLIKKCSPPISYELLAEEDKDRIGCPIMVKNLVEKSRFDFVCFLGDDTIPQKGFLFHALEEMKKIRDGWGLIGLNDLTGRTLPTHWLASKKLLPMLGGEFFHTGYTHCCCDVELMERCQSVGRYRYSQKAKVLHDHPIIKGEQITDPDLIRVYSKEVWGADIETFKKRRAQNWPKI